MTKSPSRPERWYDDACGTAHALELVGERWALLVVRELLFGPRRFGELRAGLPGISANVLTQRLTGLEEARILVRRQLPSPANAQVYELTPWGYECEPFVKAMGRWAARSPAHDPTLPLSAASIMLSFRTMFDASRATGLDATVGLQLGGDGFVAHVHDGALTVERRPPGKVDATITTSPTTLAAVTYGGRRLADAEADGELTIEGSRAVVRRLLALFHLPPKIS